MRNCLKRVSPYGEYGFCLGPRPYNLMSLIKDVTCPACKAKADGM